MTYTEQMAKFMVETKFEDLPRDVVQLAKLAILDALGCAFGGFSHDRAVISRHVMDSFGGTPEATVLGGTQKTSCLNAAYVNANMGVGLGADEFFCTVGHIGVPTLFPALALGERYRSSGKDLITAMAVGYEVAGRIGLSVGKLTRIVNNNVETLPVLGTASWHAMACVASAGNLIGLSQEQAVNAIGLQAHHAPVPTGRHVMLSPVTSMNGFYDTGWMAIGGILSALMSKDGYTSFPTPGILDGEYGFWRMIGAEKCDFNLMVDKLGERWWFMEQSFKPWPADGYIMQPLTALDILLRKHKVLPHEIEKVTITGGLAYPNFFNQSPKTESDAAFSVPHCVAMMILGVPAGPEWQTPENLTSPRVGDLRRRITMVVDPAIAQVISAQITKFPGIIREAPTTVEVIARGQTFTESVKYHLGNNAWSKEFKMTDEQIEQKFRVNSASILPVSTVWRRKIEGIISACRDLENLSDVQELTKWFRPGD